MHTYSRDLLYSRLIPQGRNRVVAVSNFVRDALIKKGAPTSHLETIYNGTDYLSPDTSPCSTYTIENAALECQETSPAVRTELNLPPEALLVGVFGYISELKGQEILAKAAPQIAAHCHCVHFVFVGPLVSPEIQKRIMARGEIDGTAHRLHFMGYRSDVKRLMDAMNIVVVPSQIEACSMVTLEAMARGKPILAARVGGMPELVLHNETGLLVERKAEDFAEALIRLLKDPLLCARMGAAGRQRVAEHFTSSHLTSQFEALYHKMTSPVGRHRA